MGNLFSVIEVCCEGDTNSGDGLFVVNNMNNRGGIDRIDFEFKCAGFRFGEKRVGFFGQDGERKPRYATSHEKIKQNPSKSKVKNKADKRDRPKQSRLFLFDCLLFSEVK